MKVQGSTLGVCFKVFGCGCRAVGMDCVGLGFCGIGKCISRGLTGSIAQATGCELLGVERVFTVGLRRFGGAVAKYGMASTCRRRATINRGLIERVWRGEVMNTWRGVEVVCMG